MVSGANFLRGDKILYREPNVEIITNVIMSRPLKIQQGRLQGCPLSSLLFIQAIEPFAIVVQSHKKHNCCIHKARRIESLHLLKMSLFIYFFFFFKANSVPALLDLINLFGKISGYKVNKTIFH